MRRTLLSLVLAMTSLSPLAVAGESDTSSGWALITTDPARDVEFAQEYLAVWMAVEEIDLLAMHTRETAEHREVAIEVAYLTSTPRTLISAHWIAFGFLGATGEGYVGGVHTVPGRDWYFSAEIYHPDGRVEPLEDAGYREEGNTIIFEVPRSRILSEPVEWAVTSNMRPLDSYSSTGGIRFFDAMSATWPHTVLPAGPVADVNPFYEYPR